MRRLTRRLPKSLIPLSGEREVALNARVEPVTEGDGERRVAFFLPTDMASLRMTLLYFGSGLFLLAAFIIAVTGWEELALAALGFPLGGLVVTLLIFWYEGRHFKADQIALGPVGWEARKKGKIVNSGTWDEFLGFRLKKNTRTTWVEFVDVSGSEVAKLTLGTSLITFPELEAFRREMLDRVPRFGIKEVFTPVLEDSHRDRFLGGAVASGSIVLSICAWLLLRGEGMGAEMVLPAVILVLGIGTSMTFNLQGRLAARQLDLLDRLGPTEFTTHAARPTGQFLGNFFGLVLLGLIAVLLLGMSSNGLGLGGVFWAVPAAILTQLPGHYVLGTRHLFIQHDQWTVSAGKRTMEFDPRKAVVSELRRFGLAIGRFVQIEEDGRTAVICNDAFADTTVYDELLRSQRRAKIDSPNGLPV
ncbi:MAG: hypothetical protein HONBIEJF_01121 [Fimbriimonadaceae bacterium]|nr:hypothetical protein [Fimbriimonadaceae bacterium]